MAKKSYIEKYGDKDLITKSNEKRAQAFQEGGAAPAPAGPQGGGQGQVNPEEIAMAYAQAKQSGDQQTMVQAAVAFMDAVVMPQMQQAQQGAAAMRDGGVAPELEFDKDGNLK